MRLPRFARKYAVRIDLGYKQLGNNMIGAHSRIVFISGPFKDKFFWSLDSAENYVHRVNKIDGVPRDRIHLFHLGWVASDQYSLADH